MKLIYTNRGILTESAFRDLLEDGIDVIVEGHESTPPPPDESHITEQPDYDDGPEYPSDDLETWESDQVFNDREWQDDEQRDRRADYEAEQRQEAEDLFVAAAAEFLADSLQSHGTPVASWDTADLLGELDPTGEWMEDFSPEELERLVLKAKEKVSEESKPHQGEKHLYQDLEEEIPGGAGPVGFMDTQPAVVSEQGLEEKAPPGMEDVVLALKKKFGHDSPRPFQIAWAQYNKKHGKMEEIADPPPRGPRPPPQSLSAVTGMKVPELPTGKELSTPMGRGDMLKKLVGELDSTEDIRNGLLGYMKTEDMSPEDKARCVAALRLFDDEIELGKEIIRKISEIGKHIKGVPNKQLSEVVRSGKYDPDPMDDTLESPGPTLEHYRTIVDFLEKGIKPEQIINSYMGKKLELSMDDIKDALLMNKRGLLEGISSDNKRSFAIDREGSFFADADQDSGPFGVYGSETGHCYGMFKTEAEAEAKAEALNNMRPGEGDWLNRIKMNPRNTPTKSLRESIEEVACSMEEKLPVRQEGFNGGPLAEEEEKVFSEELAILRKIRAANHELYLKWPEVMDVMTKQEGMDAKVAMDIIRKMERVIDNMEQDLQLFKDLGKTKERAQKILAKNPRIAPWIPVELGGKFVG